MSITSTNSLKANLKSGAEVCGYAIDASGYLVSDVDAFEKTLKVVSKTIALASYVKPSEAGNIIATQFKEAIMLTETFGFFKHLQSLVRPNKAGVFFLQDPANSAQKCAARVSLFVHSFLKLFVAAKKWKLMDLAIASKYLIGQLPFFTLVTDGLYGAYNFLSSWDNLIILANCRKASKLVDKKIVKWEEQAKKLDLIAAGNTNEIDNLKQKYAAQIKAIQSDKTTSKIAKLPLLQARLDKIDKKDYKTLADDIRTQDVTPKLNKWKFNKQSIQLNSTKATMGATSTAAKAASVFLTLFCIAVNAWTTPAIILATSLSLIGDTVGITRIIHDRLRGTAP